MNCNTTHYRANSSSVPGDPTKVRETAGIPQSRVEGLTERQIRRIEQGESRATTAAITTLAKAHGLDANAYMEKLSKAIR